MSSDEKTTPDGSSSFLGNVDRRSFLRVLGAAFGTVVLPEMVTSCAPNGDDGVSNNEEDLTTSGSVTVVRPHDMLVLTISFVNLKHNLVTGTLVRMSTAPTAPPPQIILDFPPQAILEDAANIGGAGNNTPFTIGTTFPSPNGTALANAMLSGPTRLIFQMPFYMMPVNGVTPLPVPYSLSSILGLCAQSSLVLSPTMQSSVCTAMTTPISSTPSGDPLVDRMLATALASDDPSAAGRSAAFNGQLPTGLGSFLGTGVTTSGSSQPPAGILDNTVTQIEMPYRLKLSPNAQSGFSHATAPVQGATKAYEVWHTVLGSRMAAQGAQAPTDERNSYLRTVRALWTRDWDAGINSAPPQIPLTPTNLIPIQNPSLQVWQREAIVANSSGIPNANPIQVNRLMLSSLGGYLDARGDWPGGPNGVARWIEKMTGGRENFVEVRPPGFLLPFGNSATSLQITQRNDNPNVGPIGELYSYNIIIIGNPVTTYRTQDVQPTTARSLLQWPFVAIQLKKTHFITQRVNGLTPTWLLDASGTPIMVPAVGYDRRGRAIHFAVPLFFAANTVHGDAALTAYHAAITAPPVVPPRTFPTPGAVPPDANNPYVGSSLAPAPYATPSATGVASLNVPMAGQRIAYADSKTTSTSSTVAPPKDDTSFATQTFAFDVAWHAGDAFQPGSTTPQYLPFVTWASIYVEALHQYLKNQPDGTMPPVDVWYHSCFLNGPGFDPTKNKSQLLFAFANQITADFTKDPSGNDRSDCGTGFIAPNMSFNALSRKTGPSYDGTAVKSTSPSGHMVMQGHVLPQGTTPISDGTFDPSTYLGMAKDALAGIKILGVFSILDIVKTVYPGDVDKDLAGLVSSAEEAALKYAPKFISEGLSELEKIVSLIAEVKSQVELLYTNAQELVGPNGTLSNAKDIVINGEQAALADVQKLVNPIVTAAQKFYGADSSSGLQATVGAIESLNINVLGDPNAGPGSILELLTNAQGLLKAVKGLTDAGARATLQAQKIAQNGSTDVSQLGIPAGVVNNAALQIATGIQQSVLTKLTQLLNALGVVDGGLGVIDGTFPQAIDIVTKFTQLFQAAEQALDAIRDMKVKIEWQPKVGSFGLSGWTIFRPASQHALTLMMEVRAKATDKESAGVDLRCRLDHFDICIGQTQDKDGPTGIITLQFDHIAFEMLAGHKPDVDVKINGLKFGGPLSFLEELKKIIPMDGFSDPPFLNIDTNGIKAGFSLQIPNIAIGMFSIENMAISAELDIPFFSTASSGGALTFTFSFCSKDAPFIITVSLLGGGGYFTVSFTPKGLQHLEASICVGAQLALNLLGIAQGSISIMAGITFTIDEEPGAPGQPDVQDVKLTAFLRLHGELDICGIISISIDLSVSMTFDFTHHIIIAEAKIKVDVSILFFSMHVELPFRKEFHSCNNDPTLRMLMPPNPGNVASQYWADYCNAYAA